MFNVSSVYERNFTFYQQFLENGCNYWEKDFLNPSNNYLIAIKMDNIEHLYKCYEILSESGDKISEVWSSGAKIVAYQ